MVSVSILQHQTTELISTSPVVQAQLQPAQLDKHELDSFDEHGGTVFSILFLISLTCGILLYRKFCDLKELASNSSSFHKANTSSSRSELGLRCINCRYFSGNAFLSCAVNPAAVLKPAAKDCTDFENGGITQ